MKKLFLISAAALFSFAATAQIYLKGSSYSQNFDNIGSGLPAGWTVYTKATPFSAGNDVSSSNYNANHVRWTNSTGGFRNSASANNFAFYALADTASQSAATDRALSVRQVAYTNASFPGSDSGAAFVLQIANTIYFSDFSLSVKLQSLDSTAQRATTWRVDYALGANPTSFTQVPVNGTNVTGGNSYSNNIITANFGSALDTNVGPVWIRIVALNASTGSNSRTTTGIDDFHLSWSGTLPNPEISSLYPANNSAGVNPNTNLMITFNKLVQKSSGNIFIINETDNTVTTISAGSPDVTVIDSVVTIANAGLTFSKTYHITFDSTAFDSAGFYSEGLYDTTAWKFSTGPNSISLINARNNLPLAVLGRAEGNSVSVLFTLEKPSVVSVTIYNLNGRAVYSNNIIGVRGDNRRSFITRDLPNGIYLLMVSTDNGRGVTKFVVE